MLVLPFFPLRDNVPGHYVVAALDVRTTTAGLLAIASPVGRVLHCRLAHRSDGLPRALEQVCDIAVCGPAEDTPIGGGRDAGHIGVSGQIDHVDDKPRFCSGNVSRYGAVVGATVLAAVGYQQNGAAVAAAGAW